MERAVPLVIGRPGRRGAMGRDNRMLVAGVSWIVRTGLPCRNLLETA